MSPSDMDYGFQVNVLIGFQYLQMNGSLSVSVSLAFSCGLFIRFALFYTNVLVLLETN